MATIIIKKTTGGVTYQRNGGEIISLFGTPDQLQTQGSKVILRENGNDLDFVASDTITINDVSFTGTAAQIADKLRDEVFFLEDDGTGGTPETTSSILGKIGDGSTIDPDYLPGFPFSGAQFEIEAGTGLFRFKDSYLIALIQANSGGSSNVAPTVNSGTDQNLASGTTSTTLTATASDSDGTIASYAWTRVSGPNTPTIASPSAATTNVTGMVAGTYVFRCTVTDNAGGTKTDDISVTIASASAVTSKFVDVGLTSGTTTFNGQVFEADTYASGGSTYTDAGAVTGTSYQDAYKSVRFATSNAITHSFPSILNGNYTVHIHYRSFNTNANGVNVTINGTAVDTNLNVYGTAGAANKALIRSHNVVVSNGQITILHTVVFDQVNIAAIEIVAQGTASKLA
ncbi:Di-glucose binding within endoplasmic reticulum [Cnuella takakiae]|uniref:Di-glucose binding within endoplasmic reticulum n=1 Tax=Cnuella takakiae TaxID=1302690 RepID=A0A1M4VU57_9BACT|nr:malectin domain-containing carbohydrate-binding protein [Cnuella takakiae]OLY92496.1 hypothetical protein BUE76_11810 [Cnuella takakiae]SHE72499.1 Di-glucose binding within endoplasmic reticulum [Cnuella takakiae]